MIQNGGFEDFGGSPWTGWTADGWRDDQQEPIADLVQATITIGPVSPIPANGLTSDPFAVVNGSTHRVTASVRTGFFAPNQEPCGTLYLEVDRGNGIFVELDSLPDPLDHDIHTMTGNFRALGSAARVRFRVAGTPPSTQAGSWSVDEASEQEPP